jgi:hypothetical protein
VAAWMRALAAAAREGVAAPLLPARALGEASAPGEPPPLLRAATPAPLVAVRADPAPGVAAPLLPARALGEPSAPGEPPASLRAATPALLVAARAGPAPHRRLREEPMAPAAARGRVTPQVGRGARGGARVDLSAAVPAMAERRVPATRAAAVAAQSAQEGRRRRAAQVPLYFFLASVRWAGQIGGGGVGGETGEARMASYSLFATVPDVGLASIQAIASGPGEGRRSVRLVNQSATGPGL